MEPVTQVKEGGHFPGARPSVCVNSRGGMENGYKWVQLSASSGGGKLSAHFPSELQSRNTFSEWRGLG